MAMLNTYSQTITRSVTASTGSVNPGSTITSSTIGPSVLNTEHLDTVTFTQGFQQPKTGLITFEFVTVEPDCYDLSSGIIDLTLEGCTGDYALLWETGDTSTVLENLSTGFYTFSVTSGLCSLTDSIFVGLNTDCGEEIANLVSANSDGVNDELIIPQFHFEENQENSVAIYNRWGQLVWEAENYNNTSISWKGSDLDGNSLPTGTYYYIVLMKGEEKSGFIELLR